MGVCENPDSARPGRRSPPRADRPPPAVMTSAEPLLLLAIPSVVIGYLTIQPMLYGDFLKDAIFVDLHRHPAMEGVTSIL